MNTLDDLQVEMQKEIDAVGPEEWESLPHGSDKYGSFYASKKWSICKRYRRKYCGDYCEKCLKPIVKMSACHHSNTNNYFNPKLKDLRIYHMECHREHHASSKNQNKKPIKMPTIKSYKIKVTQKIIDMADIETTKTCMVAIAIREQILGSSSIHVDASSINFNLDGWRYHYNTPGKCSHAICQFDIDKQRVTPFQFRLDAGTGTIGPLRVRRKPLKQQTKRKTVGTRREPRRCQRRYHGIVQTM